MAALDKIIAVGAAGVLGRELDVGAERRGESDRRADLLEYLFARLAELVLQVDVRGGQEGVDAGALGALESFPGALDIKLARSRQRRDDGPADLG